MSGVLCSFPGKFGDLLWALPSIRALSETLDSPIDLAVAAETGSICALLSAQPYIGRAFAIPEWIGLAEPHMPWRAPTVAGYERQIDLGYRGWPQHPLAQETYETLQREYIERGERWDKLPVLDLARPWIRLPPTLPVDGMMIADLSIGFTDEHFELKLGVTALVLEAIHATTRHALAAPGSRWATEGHTRPSTWIEAARTIATSRVFVGCCSALHVLAVGLGVPVVMMEPSIARHNPIFFPLGNGGPQVRLVRGGDGEPTFDARAVAEALRAAREVRG